MTICKHVNDNGEKCKTRSGYNIEGEKKALYCAVHKKENMINVVSKRCIEEKCKTRATYNIPGEKPLYCAAHKKENMINVVSKRCIEEGCKILPTYNITGEKEALYCAKHKKEDMINVVSKRCIEEGCKIRPNFNIPGEKQALYCAVHKKADMVDVKHKRCIEEGCKTLPIYNIPGEKQALFCFTHKKDGMINVINKRCIEEGCKTRANFNIKGEKALYCAAHKKVGMIDVKHKKCLINLCDIRPTKEGYCSRCFYYTFPDKPQSRNYKSKEILVTNYIKDNFEEYEIRYDQIISQGCSRRRPDIFIELYTHCIIVEVDEDQHLGYDSTCENKRIVELYQDLGYRNMIYIRFNPDKYKVKYDNGIEKTIRSCFSKDKDGKLKIGSTKDWNHRLEKLNECIAKNIENIPSKSISYEYLFYDETK